MLFLFHQTLEESEGVRVGDTGDIDATRIHPKLGEISSNYGTTMPIHRTV
jgi:hypothetical protein